MRQGKTQSAGIGSPLPRTATPHWRIWPLLALLKPQNKVERGTNPKISLICADIAQDIDFTRKFPKERRIRDYGRLRKYFLWNQETSEIKHNL